MAVVPILIDSADLPRVQQALRRALRPIRGGGVAQVREDEGGISIFVPASPGASSKDAPVDDRYRRVHNTSTTEAIVAGGCAVIVDYDYTSNHYNVRKATSDNEEQAIIVVADIVADGIGVGVDFGDGVIAYEGTAPASGGRVGSKSGSWKWQASSGGTLVVDGVDTSGNTARVRFRSLTSSSIYSDGYAWVNRLTNVVDSRTQAAATLWQNYGGSSLFNTEAWIHFPTNTPGTFGTQLMIALNMAIWGVVWVQGRGGCILTVYVDLITADWTPATLNAASLPATSVASSFEVRLSVYPLPIFVGEPPDTRLAKAVYNPLMGNPQAPGQPPEYNPNPYQTIVEVPASPPATVYGIRIRFAADNDSSVTGGATLAWRWQSYYLGKCALIQLQT